MRAWPMSLLVLAVLLFCAGLVLGVTVGEWITPSALMAVAVAVAVVGVVLGRQAAD